jgi:hypothetical protein
MTDTLMIVFGVILLILTLYVAISIILIALMLATKVYCIFFKKVKACVAQLRENKDASSR